MGSTNDDAARERAERHDRHAAALERHERNVERAGPMPMIQSDSGKRKYAEGQAWADSEYVEFMIEDCERQDPVFVAGFCDRIADALTDCREAADKGGEA